MQSAPEVELLQFPYSHFNEKARWALDWKRQPHVRTNLLPGAHAIRLKRLTGDTLVPVAIFAGEVVPGSERIIDALEARVPEPPLYPADPAERRRALEIQRWFDDEVGPLVRRAVFSVMLDVPAYVCRMFSEGHGAVARGCFRAGFPLVSRLMARSMGIRDDASVAQGFAGAKKGLDFVASEAGPEGYLVGDAFSVADLAAAALLAPCANPPDSPMHRPEPVPAVMRERWNERWTEEPGVAWVRDMYRRHRPASAAVAVAG